MTDRSESFLLEFPPEAHYVSTARIFAAGVARTFGTEEDMVEDLKIAVSEACTNAIKAREQGTVDGPVRLLVRRDADLLSFETEDTGIVPAGDGPEPVIPSSGSTSEDIARRLSLETIRVLFPGTEIVPNDQGGGNIRFSLPVPAAGRSA
jgi:anti-sigma regulatory factor (Ser/Thr protein kinase)